MRKYMKYEIRGNYKFILGIIAIIIIVSTIIQANILREVNRVYINTGDTFTFMDFLLIVAVFVAFGSLLVAFFRIIGSFKDELYEDRGYLTFTLPLTGNQILGAKLLVAVLWILILAIVMALYNIVLATILFGLDWGMMIEVLEYTIGKYELGAFMRIIPLHILLGGISLFGTLILIFFSMALGKVSIRNRKIGGLWFIIFIIIAALSSYLTTRIGFELPLYFDIVNLRVTNMSTPWLYDFTPNDMLEVSSILTHISITSVLSELLIYVGAFISTGYLIEKKIDL
ncbi:MAG TPA: hypothetical protein VFC79_14435 [Tissierellaceae bacterium]|nr:hypothetical protein [Tissierellaceae bacterium]